MPTGRSPSTHDGFLVERYLPASAAAGLASSVAAVAALCGSRPGVEGAIRYVQSMYLPTEDTCFCLFRAASMDAVRHVNAEGGFALDRITPAVLLLPPSFSPTATHRKGTP